MQAPGGVAWVEVAAKATRTAQGQALSTEALASGTFALVLCMRPYQNDPLVNHHVSKYFTRLGVPVIPADILPGLADEDLSGLEVRRRLA